MSLEIMTGEPAWKLEARETQGRMEQALTAARTIVPPHPELLDPRVFWNLMADQGHTDSDARYGIEAMLAAGEVRYTDEFFIQRTPQIA